MIDSTASHKLRHARIKAVFFHARERSGTDRLTYLDSECGGDADLRRDVELLLAADETESLPGAAVAGNIPFGPSLLEPGTAIDGRFRVDGLIAEGGAGVVYRATQLKLERSVAVKVLRGTAGSDPASALRFEREALAVARLRHPHVVTTIDFGVAPNVGAYLVLELVAGKSLRQELREREGEHLSAGAAVEILRQICSGVQAAHDLGIVHRDLKPENVAVEWTPEGPFAKVLDFGIARMYGGFLGHTSRLTVSGAFVGTPRYVSPEQCSGHDADARSDVYGLGCMLYEMLAGRPPFVGNSAVEVLAQHVNAIPRPPRELVPDIPEAIEAVVLRALAKDPAARFQSADELRGALAGALGRSPGLRDEPGAAVSAKQTEREHLGVVFVVDDNPTNLTVLANILRRQGYRVKVASRGARAVAAVQAEPPDLMMLDIQMPDMDGYEVCRELKADASTRDIPIIFISALDDVSVKVRAFKSGGIDYVTKPFQAEEVLARVESQLQLARLRKDLERRNGELLAANEALVLANRRADRVFSALSETLPGTLLDGKYRLDEKIGSGGYGVVFRAEHVGLRRPVAVKIFKPVSGNDSSEGLSRFEHEGISACRVNHSNAIAVLDSGLSPAGSAYLVMELLEGRTLADEIRETGRFSIERAVAIAVPICDALAAAHDAGIVHRDVKPENIFLHRERGGREGEIVKVLDFGLAKVVGDELGLEGPPSKALAGTPAYIAPERLWGKAYDGRADVYSVGVILYRMLTGEPPFHASDNVHALIAMSVNLDPVPPRERRPDVGADVDALVMRALAKDPNARFTARDLAAALREAAAG